VHFALFAVLAVKGRLLAVPVQTQKHGSACP